MKKSIYSVIAFAAFAVSAFANPAGEVDFKVPFAFKAGSSTLPAGSYRVTEATPGIVLIRGEKGGVFVPRSAVVMGTNESGKTTFRFDRAGDLYVLQSVNTEK